MEYKKILISCVNNPDKKIELQYEANGTCPICNIVSKNNLIRAFFTTTATQRIVFIERICHECGEVSINRYTFPLHSSANFSTQYRSYTQLPSKHCNIKIDNIITTISPRFKEIYSQAIFAEIEECDEICGMGYRKALEFLVKDYLIRKTPKEKDTISVESLAHSINRIEDNRIKILASRSAWLGNDECHYVRKHEDYGLEELKVFIDAMLSYISSELTFEKALEMPYKP